MRLLLVDTDVKLCRGIQSICREEAPAAEVLRAEDGLRALELLRRERVDLMMLALVLPRLDGLALLEEMRRMKVRTHVLITTQITNEMILRKALNLGAEYYMIKPVEPETACRRIRDLVSGPVGAPPGARGQEAARMLEALRLSDRSLGSQYLAEAVRLARENPAVLRNLRASVYSPVALQYGKEVSAVERSVRYAVSLMWKRMTRQQLSACLGLRPGQLQGPLTNRECIARLADRLSWEDLQSPWNDL